MIKTIWSADSEKFDDMVNAAIKEGWVLRARDIRDITPNLRGFYAELDKPDEGHNEEAVEALRAVKEICSVQKSCADCPMGAFIGDCVCDIKEPERWNLPE